jgi:hypothetical protein
MKRTIKAWAVFHKNGKIMYHTIRFNKNKAEWQAVPWGYCTFRPLQERYGYRVRRITITVEET